MAEKTEAAEKPAADIEVIDTKLDEASGSVGAAPVEAEPEVVEDAALEAAEGDLEDIDHEHDPGSVGAAPPRPHEMIVSQLRIRFEELINFVRDLEGELDGDLGDLLTFMRSKIK
jgi:hypothetical protein